MLNFRFADAPVADTSWCRKTHGVVLANTPGLARLHVRFDDSTRRLGFILKPVALGGWSLDEAGRQCLVDAVTQYVASLDANPLEGRGERLPLKLVGDGVMPRYQDNEAGQVRRNDRGHAGARFECQHAGIGATLRGQIESVGAVADRLDAEINPCRPASRRPGNRAAHRRRAESRAPRSGQLIVAFLRQPVKALSSITSATGSPYAPRSRGSASTSAVGITSASVAHIASTRADSRQRGVLGNTGESQVPPASFRGRGFRSIGTTAGSSPVSRNSCRAAIGNRQVPAR